MKRNYVYIGSLHNMVGLVAILLCIILRTSNGIQDISIPQLPTSLSGTISDVHPDFTGPIQNVTVAVGREAVLSCTVTELGHYKVGWMKAEDQTILTLHTRVVTHNSRISVTHDNLRTWQLRIRQLKESDRGCYMCQINTSTMKKQIGCVDVHVPPDIDDVQTSGDITVTEGGNATLTCSASGHPTPRILWRREDGSNLIIRKNQDAVKVDTYSGDTLTLRKLDRKQMGAYLCIASNDVPPAVSKRILLNIQFAPAVKVPNHLIGGPFNTDLRLECFVEAFPNTVNYWVKSHNEVLLDGRKHVVTESRDGYRVHLVMTIKDFSASDLGTYMCVSANSMGRADGTIRVYEIKLSTRPPTTTTTTTSMPITIPYIEYTVPPTPEPPELQNYLDQTTLDPLDAVIEDSVLDNALAPSVATIPREYSANYAASQPSSHCLPIYWKILLFTLIYIQFIFR